MAGQSQEREALEVSRTRHLSSPSSTSASAPSPLIPDRDDAWERKEEETTQTASHEQFERASQRFATLVSPSTLVGEEEFPPYRDFSPAPQDRAERTQNDLEAALNRQIGSSFLAQPDRDYHFPEAGANWSDSSSETTLSDRTSFDWDEKLANYPRDQVIFIRGKPYVPAMASMRDHDFPSPNGSGNGKVSYPFPDARPGGPSVPLISYVRNDWRRRARSFARRSGWGHGRRRSGSPYGSSRGILKPEWEDYLRSRAFRRHACLYLTIFIMLMIGGFRWAGPSVTESSRLQESINNRMKTSSDFFGSNVRVAFNGVTQVEKLPQWMIPGAAEAKNDRRLIFIGDIHGCIDELNQLLDKTGFDADTDHIVTTGDMVSRGPASGDVVSLLAKHNASCVRGNHEDRLLLRHRDLSSPAHRNALSSSPGHERSRYREPASSDATLATTLSDDNIAYLRACPLILDVGPVPAAAALGSIAVAHAGLVPLVPLTRQDPAAVMTMRALDLRSHVPQRYPPAQDPIAKANERDKMGRPYAVAWQKLWDAWQDMRRAGDGVSAEADIGKRTVLYGHDRDPEGDVASVAVAAEAKKNRRRKKVVAKVQRDRWSWGLDAGCVAGGKLAALVIGPGSKQEVVTVDCRNYLDEEFNRNSGVFGEN